MNTIFLIGLVMVLGCLGYGTQDEVQWKVLHKIDKYGDNLTLICKERNEAHLSSNMTLSWHMGQHLCAKDNSSGDRSKYQPKIVPSEGGYLKIINFGKDDINKTYRCTIGFQKSEKVLSEDAVFNNKVDVLKPASIDKDESHTNSAIFILVPLIIVGFVVAVAIIIWYRYRITFNRIIQHCKRGHTPDVNEPNQEYINRNQQDPENVHLEPNQEYINRNQQDPENVHLDYIGDEGQRVSDRHFVDNEDEDSSSESVVNDRHHENNDERLPLLNSENGMDRHSVDNEETANKSVGSDRHHENHEETQSLLNSENGGGMQSDDKEETSVLRYAENESDQCLQNDGETQSISDPGNVSNTHSEHDEAASMLEDSGNVPNRGAEGGGERTHASDQYNDLGHTAGPRNKARYGGETPNSAPVVHLSGTDRNTSQYSSSNNGNSVHAPYKVIGKNTALAISGQPTNVPVVSEDAENCGGREARDPKIPHREPINRGFQYTIPDPPEDNASATRVLSPRHREYNDIKIRIQSFTKPLPFSRPSKEELAEAGFFYSGYRSRANCFFCGKRCDFKDGDDPSDKHFHEDTCKHCKK